MSSRNVFIRGAFVLGIAAMLSKLLGSVYTIFLQNIIGDRGIGLYQMAYPIYATLLNFSTAGFPIAISKFVAERLAIGDDQGAKKVFRISLFVLAISGLFFFVLLFGSASFYAKLSGDPAAKYAIQAIAPALLVVPIMSALRGYFQGWQTMEPTATSQVIEQLIRVATILIGSVWLLQLGFGTEIAAAGAAFGAVTGAIAGLITLLIVAWRKRNVFLYRSSMRVVASESTGRIIQQLVYYALPISLGALVVPLMNNVDVLTVVNELKQSGASQMQATEMFGLLTGRAFKLMMLPATFATAIGAALMPAIASAKAVNNTFLIKNRIDMAMRMTMLMGMPAAVGLCLLARPVDTMLFKTSDGWDTIAIMSLGILFSTVQVTSSAVLQGLGNVYIPVANMMFGAVVKYVLNVILVPLYGINGAAWATVLSYFVACMLNLWSVYHRTHISFDLKAWLIRPSLSVFFMGVAVFAALRQFGPFVWTLELSNRMASSVLTVTTILIGIAVYGIGLFATGSVSRREVESVPRLGPGLARFCSRIGLLR
ncbi:polysaccharide biosynthesis protein [Fodinisporobacter ferrooxydans]|uniref:Polysaccharide biosynthesis protein n=1 Tax=Fodinisporobacter ferrooxydans TaxID=2901836 RepID=A0ABY4CPC3_9BACL|nr:polysaccharide biosynthesis protein [Alicyclobacillaceae bacterium MYW30-H2]